MLRTAFAIIFGIYALCGVAVAQMPFGVQTVILDKPGALPAIDLNFAAGTSAVCSSIAACISVSRSTQETCEIPGASTITYAAANTTCTGGLQVFGAGTNLIPQSQAVTGWTHPTAGDGLVGSVAGAPDGTATALQLTDSNTNATHTARSGSINGGTGFVSGTSYVFSLFVKAGTCAGVTPECHTGIITTTVAPTPALEFDAADCTIHGATALTVTVLDIQKVFTPEKFGSWCRFAFVVTATATLAGSFEIGMEQGLNNSTARATTYTGAGGTNSTMLFWGADLKVGTQLLPYCPTAGSNTTCNADVVTAIGPLKTYLEGSALRAVFKTAQIFGQQPQAGVASAAGIPQTLLGTGTALTGLGIKTGYQAQTNWPVTATLNTAGQIIPGIQNNFFGISANGSGRSLALNGQTAVSDSNGLSATSAEYIGSLSNGTAYCNCIISEIQVWASRNDAAMLAATANANALPLLASYTGAVANVTRVPQTTVAFNVEMARSHHRASENITSLTAIFGNYSLISGSPEAAPGHTATIAASIEYPLGTCAPFAFSSSATGTISDGGQLASDALTIAIPAGDDFWVRTWRQMAGGGTVMPQSTLIDRQALELTETGGTDKTGVGCAAITGNLTTSTYRPDALVGPTQLQSYCEVGDSRVGLTGDLAWDVSDQMGEIERWVAPYYSVLNIGVGAARADTFIAHGANRQALLQYCSGMIVAMGFNDTYAGGLSAVTTEGNLSTIYGYSTTLLHGTPGLSNVWAVTIDAQDASSDSFATTANQTPTAPATATILDPINAWIRANTAGVAGFFDNQAAIQSSNKWFANGTGATFGFTVDGTHASSNGYYTIKNAHPFPLGLQ